MDCNLYIAIYFRAFAQWIDGKASGTTFREVSGKIVASLPFPLPPLAEQHRIVAKVDELMALCDKLEAAQRDRESCRDRLTGASHHHLNNGADAEAIRGHAQFFIGHIPRLTKRPDQIKQLRQTILNLAVHGKLVAPNSTDGDTSPQLLQNDKVRQVIAKTDRRADLHRQNLMASNLRWAVPATWQWVALADVVLFIDYRGKTPNKITNGVRLITAKNVKKGFIDLSPEEFLSESEYHAWMTRGLPSHGDILFTTEAPMGNAAVVNLTDRFALAQRVICFRPYGGAETKFITLQILSEPFQAILDEMATGLTAKGIKAAKLKHLPLAIPPLAEQYRIVAKVDELMALCDQLESSLNTAQTATSRLLESVLHHALEASA
jgi:type I restriction enzyme S subunit